MTTKFYFASTKEFTGNGLLTRIYDNMEDAIRNANSDDDCICTIVVESCHHLVVHKELGTEVTNG